MSGLSQMFVFVIVAAVGYLAAKKAILDPHTKNKLMQLLLNVTLPCMIVASVHNLSASEAGAVVAPAFGMAAAQYFILFATGALLAVILRANREDLTVYIYITTCTNNGFIGLPVIAAILGNESVIISSIYIMVFAFFGFSIGNGMLAQHEKRVALASGNPELAEMHQGSSLKSLLKSMANPSMIGSVIALALFFTGIQVPSLVQDSLSLLGSITSPVAMLVVGAIIAEADFKDIVTEIRIYPYIIMRQLLLPAGFYGGLSALGFSPLLAGVFTLMFAMPTGSMAPAFISNYHGNAQLSAKYTVMTTIGAFVAIPLLVTFRPFAG